MARITIAATAMTERSRNAARIAFASSAVFVILLAALHILEPEIDPSWASARRTLLWTAGLPLIGLVVFILSTASMLPPPGGRFSPDVQVGWPNRIMILAHCAWLMPVAWRAIKLPV